LLTANVCLNLCGWMPGKAFPESEREIPYYYYIVKNFIAEHESRFGTIPIQVHNEHRMAYK